MLFNLIGPLACGIAVGLGTCLLENPQEGYSLAVLTCVGYTVGLLTSYNKECDCDK
jgi:hypothetical protein